MSNNTPAYDSKLRAMKMLEIFKSVADKITDGIPDLPANDNNPYPSTKSLKSFKSRPAA